MELCSQSGGNWLHQSEMQMSGIRAVNLEGFKNTACLDLELESVSTLMWSTEKNGCLSSTRRMKPFFFLSDITRNLKASEPADCGPASRAWQSYTANLASALQLWCCCCRASVCTGSVCCRSLSPASLHAASASSRLCDEPAHKTTTWDEASF